MKLLSRFALSSLTVTCLASQALGYEWLTAGGDYQRTGRAPVDVSVDRLVPLWTLPETETDAIIAGETVVTRSRFAGPTYVTALNASTGSIKWRVQTDIAPSPITVMGNYVAYITSHPTLIGAGQLEVRSLDTGNLIRSTIVVERNASSPILRPLANGQVEILVAGNNFCSRHVLSGNNITTSWTRSLNISSAAMPAIVGDSMVMASTTNYYAVRISDGLVRRFHNGGLSGGSGSRVVVNSTFNTFYISEYYSASTPYRLSAYRYTSIDEVIPLWSVPIDNPGENSDPALLPDGSIALTTEGRLKVFNQYTGEVLRQTANIGASEQTLTLTDGLIWVSTPTGVTAFTQDTLLPTGTLAHTPSQGSSDTAFLSVSSKYLAQYNGTSGSPFRFFCRA